MGSREDDDYWNDKYESMICFGCEASLDDSEAYEIGGEFYCDGCAVE